MARHLLCYLFHPVCPRGLSWDPCCLLRSSIGRTQPNFVLVSTCWASCIIQAKLIEVAVVLANSAAPLDFCRGVSWPVNWYRLMLRHVIRHMANMWVPVCELAMWGRLSAGFFFDFFPFSRRTLPYYVLSALDFGEFKRFDGNIYWNLRELSLFINTTWLWDVNRENTYILIAFVD